MRIWIDPGHGGSDFGAISSDLVEKDINLEVGLELKRILKLSGFEVGISREKDKFITLKERCKMANAFKADLFISIHHNAGGGERGEVIHSIRNIKSKEFALIVADEFKKLGQKEVRVYSKKNILGQDYYYIFRNTMMPSVITEFCFIDSNNRRLADTREERQSEAMAIAASICKYFKVKMVTDYLKFTRMLKLKSPYMEGDDIKLLQEKLNKLGFNAGEVDGIFGEKTKEAVKLFQKANNLVVDGIVGPKTWNKLFDV